jgi:hypothetical protein
MGVIPRIIDMLFGDGRNVVAETMGVFRENAESGAVRDSAAKQQALAQFASEFGQPRKGVFDRFIDGLNRLPRPMLAFGTLGLMVSAMVSPIWFASRMQGIALVPEPLWWLMGAIVSFYFGARHQAISQNFQRSVVQAVGMAGQVTRNIAALDALDAGAGRTQTDVAPTETNPAPDAWRDQPNG